MSDNIFELARKMCEGQEITFEEARLLHEIRKDEEAFREFSVCTMLLDFPNSVDMMAIAAEPKVATLPPEDYFHVDDLVADALPMDFSDFDDEK